MSKASEPKAVAPRQPASEFSREQVELLKRTVCKGSSDDELRLFLAQCRRTKLDPFARQIFAVRRWDARERREVMATQVSVDGFRLIAERSGKYAGQTEPQWCGLDGKWVNVWLAEEPPAAARIGVIRSDFREPCYAVARYGAYVQIRKEGGPNAMWARMPDVMLLKCAESLALRKSFPQELSGLYTDIELTTDNDSEPPRAAPVMDAPVAVQQEGPARPWKSFKGMVEEFGKLHARLRAEHNHVYREVLSEFKVEHCNQFQDYRTAAAAYQKLLARVLKLEDAANLSEEAAYAAEASRDQEEANDQS